MKIAVVGCGAVGSYYGAKLLQAGEDVHFLLRSDYDVVRARGVSLQSPDGNFQAHPACARRPDEIGQVDLVLIGLKTTANDQFKNLLPPLVGPATAILTLQNGLGNEEALARLFPAEQILGGLCFVCLNRIEPGVIRHQGYGMVMLGEFERAPVPRTFDLAERFRRGGVNCRVADDLARAHWEKLVWNIPFNGLGVAAAAGYEAFNGPESEVRLPTPMGPCLTTDALLADCRWEKLVRELMLEVVRSARALGFDLPDALAEKQLDRTRTMGAYKASTLIDFERGLPLELGALFEEPLRRIRRPGMSAPRLERLCEVLKRLAKLEAQERQEEDPTKRRPANSTGTV
jgi:2-dehydropantoate 2-reductase